MEKIVVQSDTINIPRIGDFVGVLCNDLHIDNYCATVTVAVSRAAEFAVASSSSLTVMFDYCRGGVCFQVSSDQPAFAGNSSDEAMILVRMLADQVDVVNDGRTLRLMFAVQGISARESFQRQQVLQKFYVPALVEA